MSPFDRLLQPGGFVLFQRVQVVQPLQEQQVGNLLDDFQRVGDAARPEGVPDGVDLGADFACEHVGILIGREEPQRAWGIPRGCQCGSEHA